ncbi:type I-B CRISPR-associated endonuclease Cas1b [Pampinifervens florentissimum]|uniref:type I-B CRISPR-associated endonuclease Cas1b n=1 Tax=Pampinifervens florentissimum TaxID=1632019 RepID=UPI0013B49F2B|nr:type I-B CRISPR-associated endonuclease Cas1b [Hydrogenobacter sp. T-8]QID33513.1 type I-B CRISPR-associated endonuclease Cas1 [Hydrogenobacter sp. T-8]
MGRVYYITHSGELRREENTIIFENSSIKKSIPIEDIDELFLFSEVSTNSKALALLSKKGVIAHFFNHYGYYIGSFYPRETNLSGFLLIKQVEHYTNTQKRLYLAKAFVEGAIVNLSTLFGLRKEDYLFALREAKNIPEVMKVEADLRKDFYRRLEQETGWEFEKRTKRPPQNPLNALISFGNSLVYAKVLGEVYHTQLNPTVSYLHEPSTKRFSLCLDIAEVFKPILSDVLIVKLIRDGVLQEYHFSEELNFTYLSPEGRRLFAKAFDELLESTVRHRRLKRKISHRQLIRLELYKLIKHLLAEENYRPLNYASL